jgi:hypothetical protein
MVTLNTIIQTSLQQSSQDNTYHVITVSGNTLEIVVDKTTIMRRNVNKSTLTSIRHQYNIIILEKKLFL